MGLLERWDERNQAVAARQRDDPDGLGYVDGPWFRAQMGLEAVATVAVAATGNLVPAAVFGSMVIGKTGVLAARHRRRRSG